jgi:hypothetical protein
MTRKMFLLNFKYFYSSSLPLCTMELGIIGSLLPDQFGVVGLTTPSAPTTVGIAEIQDETVEGTNHGTIQLANPVTLEPNSTTSCTVRLLDDGRVEFACDGKTTQRTVESYRFNNGRVAPAYSVMGVIKSVKCCNHYSLILNGVKMDLFIKSDKSAGVNRVPVEPSKLPVGIKLMLVPSVQELQEAYMVAAPCIFSHNYHTFSNNCQKFTDSMVSAATMGMFKVIMQTSVRGILSCCCGGCSREDACIVMTSIGEQSLEKTTGHHE